MNDTENRRMQTELLQTILLKLTKMEEKVENIEKKQIESEKRNSKGNFDITPYFPISSLAVLSDFMSNTDGNFKEKKDEFVDYLNSVSDMDCDDLDNFSSKLLSSLFTKKFIRTHRWPSSE